MKYDEYYGVSYGNNLRLSLIEEKRGNYKKALEYDRKELEITDSIYKAQKSTLLQDLEQKYNAQRLADSNKYLVKQTRIYRALGSCAALVVLLLAVLMFREVRRRKQKFAEMQNLIDSFVEKQQELQQVNESLSNNLNSQEAKTVHLRDALQRKFDNIRALLAKVSKLEKQPEEFMSEFHKFLRVDAKEAEHVFSDLVEVVNLNYNGFADYLQQLHPDLNKDEVRFCCLVALGFSAAQIGFIYGLNHPKTVYSRRLIIRNKLNLKGETSTIEEYIQKIMLGNNR